MKAKTVGDLVVRHVLDANALLREYFLAGGKAKHLKDPITKPSLVVAVRELRKLEQQTPGCFGKEFWPRAKNCRKCFVAEGCQKIDFKWRPRAIAKKYNPDLMLLDCDAFATEEAPITELTQPENKFSIETVNPAFYKNARNDDRFVALSFKYYDLAAKWPNGYHLAKTQWEIDDLNRVYLLELVGTAFYAHYYTRAQLESLMRRGFGHKKYKINRTDLAGALSDYSYGSINDMPDLNPPGIRLSRKAQENILKDAMAKTKSVWDSYRQGDVLYELIKKYGLPQKINSIPYKGKIHIVELRTEGVLYVAYIDVAENKKYDVDEQLFPTLGMCAQYISQTKNRVWSAKRFFNLGD